MVKALSVAMVLLLAASALAATKGSLQLTEAVSVSGKKLSAGEYTVKWEGAGPAVEANIMKGKTVVATVPARLVDLQRASNSDAAVVSKADDGDAKLTQIRFSGKKYALELGQQVATGPSDNSGK